MVELIIDGMKVDVPRGTTVLEAARQLDIDIPTLCYHEALTPYGGCRLCVVEVGANGATQVVSSCKYEVEQGLDVQTSSKKVLEVRRLVVELLLAEAPEAQVVQDLAAELNVRRPRRFTVRNELCIACGQCVRACREIVGVSAIDFAERGYERIAASPFFQRSDDCIGCGTCFYICPTGAITMKDIGEGEKAALPDGQEITGPARIIDNWKVGLAMKRCKECEEPFAPEFQLQHFTDRVQLPKDFFEVCVNCREEQQGGAPSAKGT
jgi:predicted molibdopterin-dependent oxidoreductase YjgC